MRYAASDRKPVRTLLRALAVFACCALWYFGAAYGISRYFDLLFLRLGLTQDIVSPRSAVWLLHARQPLSAIFVYLGEALICAWFFHLFAGEKPSAMRPASLLSGVGVGSAAAALPAVLFLLTDSIRIEAVGLPSPDWITDAAVCAAACFAEEWLCRRLAYGRIGVGLGKKAGLAAACVSMALFGQSWAQGWNGILNALLTALFCCVLYERYGSGASFGFRFLYRCAFLLFFGFPGCGGTSPLLRFYSVSEEFLTGGSFGPDGGAFMTILLCFLLLPYILRRMRKKNPA